MRAHDRFSTLLALGTVVAVGCANPDASARRVPLGEGQLHVIEAEEDGDGPLTIASPSLATSNYIAAVLSALRAEALERGYCLDAADPDDVGPIFFTSDGIIGSLRGAECEEPNPEEEVDVEPVEGDIDPHPVDPGDWDYYEVCENDGERVTGECELPFIDPCGPEPTDEICVPVDPREIYVAHEHYVLGEGCPEDVEDAPPGLCGPSITPVQGDIDPHPDFEPIPRDCEDDPSFCDDDLVGVYLDCSEYPELCVLEFELLEHQPDRVHTDYCLDAAGVAACYAWCSANQPDACVALSVCRSASDEADCSTVEAECNGWVESCNGYCDWSACD